MRIPQIIFLVVVAYFLNKNPQLASDAFNYLFSHFSPGLAAAISANALPLANGIILLLIVLSLKKFFKG